MKVPINARTLEGLAATLLEAKHVGRLSAKEFRRLHDEFRMTDPRGDEWSVGLQTLEWHRLDGGEWIKETPPQRLHIDEETLRELESLDEGTAALPRPVRAEKPEARPAPAPAEPPAPEPAEGLCAKCGAPMEADDKFCGECGAVRPPAKPKPKPKPKPAPAAPPREPADISSQDIIEKVFAPRAEPAPPKPPTAPAGRAKPAPADDEASLFEAQPSEPPRPPVGILRIVWCSLMGASAALSYDWLMWESGAFDELEIKRLGIFFGAVILLMMMLRLAFGLMGPRGGAFIDRASLPIFFAGLTFAGSWTALGNVELLQDALDMLKGTLDPGLLAVVISVAVAFVAFGLTLLIQRTFLLPLLATLLAVILGAYALFLYYFQSQNEKFISAPAPAANLNAETRRTTAEGRGEIS